MLTLLLISTALSAMSDSTFEPVEPDDRHFEPGRSV